MGPIPANGETAILAVERGIRTTKGAKDTKGKN